VDSKAYTEFGYRGAEEISLLNKKIDRLKKRIEGLERDNQFREIGWGKLPPENKYEKSDNYDINKIKLGRKIDNE
jgi:hypothetical protein